MFIADQDTLPLPVLPSRPAVEESMQERFQRLKAFSDATGIRFCRVYHYDESRRRREMRKQGNETRVLAWL